MTENQKSTSGFLLVVLSLGFIMAVLDTTGIVLAVPHIETAMRVSLDQSIWIINAYILALGALLLLSGNLSTKYGAKRILLIGMLIFTLSSIGCALASNIEMLIGLRFIQGFGAALFMPSSLALLFMSYPDAGTRASMLGIWTAIISVATGAGSFIAGIIINYFGWRGIFLINVPLGIVTMLAIMWLVKMNVANPKIRLDIWSNLLLVATIGSLVIYLVKGNQYGYGQLGTLACLLLAVIFGLLLVLRERKSTAPIVPHQLLKNAQFITSNFLGLVVNISLYGIVLVLGLYFQTQLHYTPLLSGLLILPGMMLLIIGNVFYTKAVKGTKPGVLATASIVLIILGAAGIFGLTLCLNSLPLGWLLILFALMSFGIGILTPATTTLLMEAAGQAFSGIAGATLNANKQIGGLFGTTIMGIVITSFAQNWMDILMVTFLINVLLYLVTWLVSRKYLT